MAFTVVCRTHLCAVRKTPVTCHKHTTQLTEKWLWSEVLSYIPMLLQSSYSLTETQSPALSDIGEVASDGPSMWLVSWSPVSDTRHLSADGLTVSLSTDSQTGTSAGSTHDGAMSPFIIGWSAMNDTRLSWSLPHNAHSAAKLSHKNL